MSQAAAVGAAMEYDFATKAFEGISGRYRKNGEFFHEKEICQLQGPDGPRGMFMYFFSHGGASHEGWWIGPEVGGLEVFAHNKKKHNVPPVIGWHVPFDAPAFDRGTRCDKVRRVQRSKDKR